MATPHSTGSLEVLLARADANATAVDDGRIQLSYADVDQLSNRMARVLLAMGIDGSFEVGVVLRSSAMAAVIECALEKIGAPIVGVPSAKADTHRRNHPAYATNARAIVTTTAGLELLPRYIPAVVIDGVVCQRIIDAVSDGPLECVERRIGPAVA